MVNMWISIDSFFFLGGRVCFKKLRMLLYFVATPALFESLMFLKNGLFTFGMNLCLAFFWGEFINYIE